MQCRTPHGVRGLKYNFPPFRLLPLLRRTPHGVRGLKYEADGAWHFDIDVALRMECVD